MIARVFPLKLFDQQNGLRLLEGALVVSSQKHQTGHPVEDQSQQTSGDDYQEPDDNGAHAASLVPATASEESESESRAAFHLPRALG